MRPRSFSLSLILFLFLVNSGSFAFATEDRIGRRATLQRKLDPVVIRTSQIIGLPDSHTEHLRLYAARGRTLEPVPYQFDQMDRHHRLVVRHGRTLDEFEFDRNDDFVFMAKDTGDRMGFESLPMNADVALEIRIEDPMTAEAAWAYLLHFRETAPDRSDVVYAHYDATTDTIYAKRYIIQYYPGLNFFTGMRFVSQAGVRSDNVLHRMKIRLNPTFKGGWDPVFREQDFSADIVGVKNGPVRAVRRVRQELSLGHYFPVHLKVTVHTYYYASSFITPSIFSLPWLVMKAMRDFHFSGVSDFNEKAIGMTYFDAANPSGLDLTGHNSESYETGTDHEWWVLSGEIGSCVHLFLIPKELTQAGVVRGTVFIDDDNATDPEDPTATAGVHSVGYSLLNVIEAGRSGTFETTLATVFRPGVYRAGDEKRSLEMLKQPLQTHIERLPSHP